MATSAATGIDAVAGGRRGILMALKKQGRVRAEDLAAQLGITTSAVRQHLNGLLSDGLVAYEEVRSGPGRPKHLYRLTPAAEELFPKTYSDLTNELLDYAGADRPGLVDDLFEMRRQRRADRGAAPGWQARTSTGGSRSWPASSTRTVTWPRPSASTTARGASSSTTAPSSAWPTRFGQACSSEIGFLRDVMPDAEIERTHHMMGGAHMCAYAVKPRPTNSRSTRP